VFLLAGCAAGGSPTADGSGVNPPGPDVATPFPIDRGDDPGTPGSYKGIPLRLADNGTPSVTSVDGVIGIVCVGMSNGNQECSDYIQRANGEYSGVINPAVRVVNCAVGGHAIERWIDSAYDATLWDSCITQRLPQAGVRPDQVRVIWHKAANQFTTAGGTVLPAYPAPGSDYAAFLTNLASFAARVRVKFPSVQAVYTSSRSYGGFSGNPGRGEPLSYEEGHALNSWLRENPQVQGVWYGWGPYLWAPDCATGVTNGGGICYVRSDFVEDGVHPAPGGRAEVSALLHARFGEHAWYTR
jgi:hypothetical protein